MTKKSHNSQYLVKKLGFWTLFKKFKFKVIRHFLFSTLKVILWTFLGDIIVNIFRASGKTGNYAGLLSENNWLGIKGTISKEQFLAIGLGLLLIYSIVCYWNALWEEELRVLGGYYAKSLLLDKFRRLPFEKKQAKKDELNNLIEKDAYELGYAWEHLPNHLYRSVLAIVATLIFYWDSFTRMSGVEIFFSLFWLILINLVIYWFTKKILQNEKVYKKRLDKEWTIINKEREKIILVEGMGLSSQYQVQQKKITQANQNLCLKYNRTKSLNKAIPSTFLMHAFPFILISLGGDEFQGKILHASWRIFDNFGDIFVCMWDYADYAISQERINNFLVLPEKNDNLGGKKIDPTVPIATITFHNVYFRYQGQSDWILKKYNRIFTLDKVNRLIGKNGTGKSTIIYLLLGMLQPQQGKVIITDVQGNNYNLHQDINLKDWRENNIAYCAHDTLVEQGSTGQRQLANINQILKQKKNVQIFCFDEADNALDQDNQEQVREKIKQLSKNKIVVYIKH